mgnify:CR=1 FL=1
MLPRLSRKLSELQSTTPHELGQTTRTVNSVRVSQCGSVSCQQRTALIETTTRHSKRSPPHTQYTTHTPTTHTSVIPPSTHSPAHPLIRPRTMMTGRRTAGGWCCLGFGERMNGVHVHHDNATNNNTTTLTNERTNERTTNERTNERTNEGTNERTNERRRR